MVWFAAADPALAADVAAAIRDDANAAGFELLDVTLTHVVRAAELPAHHRDPFDRMLVAQAQAEDLTLVTADAAIERYDVPLMPARA